MPSRSVSCRRIEHWKGTRFQDLHLPSPPPVSHAQDRAQPPESKQLTPVSLAPSPYSRRRQVLDREVVRGVTVQLGTRKSNVTYLKLGNNIALH